MKVPKVLLAKKTLCKSINVLITKCTVGLTQQIWFTGEEAPRVFGEIEVSSIESSCIQPLGFRVVNGSWRCSRFSHAAMYILMTLIRDCLLAVVIEEVRHGGDTDTCQVGSVCVT